VTLVTLVRIQQALIRCYGQISLIHDPVARRVNGA
jgi:hypothetical protein